MELFEWKKTWPCQIIKSLVLHSAVTGQGVLSKLRPPKNSWKRRVEPVSVYGLKIIYFFQENTEKNYSSGKKMSELL